jgi:hypothetical protein
MRTVQLRESQYLPHERRRLLGIVDDSEDILDHLSLHEMTAAIAPGP